jgi:hypothetical protein
MEFLSQFDFDIRYVKGNDNKVADALSRYYEYDTWEDICPMSDYVDADVRLDPEHDDLPWDRSREIREQHMELKAMRALGEPSRKRNTQLTERQDERDARAEQLAQAAEPVVEGRIAMTTDHGNHDPTVFESRQRGKNLVEHLSMQDTFLTDIKKGYSKDKLFSKILRFPKEHPAFTIREGLIWTRNRGGEEVLCVPTGLTRNQSLQGLITDQAHTIVGHFGPQRTVDYIRRWYWWPKIAYVVQQFCRTCPICQRAKTSTQTPMGLLHSMPIPIRPWQSIGMDFVGPFLEVDGFNYLWVVICRMTSMVHLVPVNTKTTATELSWIYLRDIVRLHCLPESIVSDRDLKFTSKWWKELHRLMGVKLLMSTSFHPQTDGATERVNRSIGRMVRSAVSTDQKDWVRTLPMTEFAINASISDSTGFTPFELNGPGMPAMLKQIPEDNRAPLGVKSFAAQALQNVAAAHDAIIASRVFQRHQANARRQEEPTINKGDLVYLSTKKLSLPKGRATKLLPKYVGLYKVVEALPQTSNYKLELPEELVKQQIHPVFHVGLLRPHHANDDVMFPNRTSIDTYDFGAPDDMQWLVDKITGHRWRGKKIELQVHWNQGDTTWEPIASCDELEALDHYLALMGIADWQQLSRKTAA